MLNGVSDLKYMCARRVSDLFSRSAKKTVLTVLRIYYTYIISVNIY